MASFPPHYTIRKGELQTKFTFLKKFFQVISDGFQKSQAAKIGRLVIS